MPGTLQRLTLRGFKTVESLDDFQQQSISVLIGPNGAGKSNFISFFRLLSWMTTPPGNLQLHVGAQGGASAILHGGPAQTREVVARLTLTTERGDNEYQFRLFHAASDTLIFAEEQYRFSRNSLHTKTSWKDLGAGHREAGLIERAETGDQTARTILSLLRKLVVYQFHASSSEFVGEPGDPRCVSH